jgi:hypothetical protein
MFKEGCLAASLVDCGVSLCTARRFSRIGCDRLGGCRLAYQEPREQGDGELACFSVFGYHDRFSMDPVY